MQLATLPAVVFSSPWMLWGLLLAVVPLVIQLFFRPRYRDEPWGAMQFLDAALQQQRQRLRFEQWLQLLVRTLLIVALVLALAQPMAEERATGGPSDSSIHWVLVWDSSLSMRAITGTESAFERGRARLLDLIDRAPQGSSFRLVRPSAHHERLLVPQPLFDADAMRLELELLQPTLDGNDWSATLRDVLTLLRSSPSSHTEVVIVSDLQQRDWAPPRSQQDRLARLFRELDQHAGLTLLDVGANVENCTIATIEAQPNQLFAGAGGEVVVSIANRGEQAATLDVDLLIDDVPHGRETISIDAGMDRSLRFPITLFEPGDHIVSVRLPEDALLADNVQRLVLPVTKQQRLLIVQAPSALARRQPADYLRLVFPTSPQILNVTPIEGGPNFVLDVAAPQDLSSLPLSGYAAILLCNVPELSHEVLTRLEQFVNLGGGLVIAQGDRVLQPEAGRRLLESSLVGATKLERVSPADAESQPHLFRPRQPDHPAIAAFRDRPEAGLSTTRVYEYVKLEFSQPEMWDTVVTYTSGDAALLTRDLGRGRIALLTTALDDSWSSWPLWPSFVPMLRELERYVTAGNARRDQLIVGETWTRASHVSGDEISDAEVLGPLAITQAAVPTITDPEQRTRLAEQANVDSEWTFAQTLQPGIYTVTTQQLSERFAVNIDPREGATQRAGIDQVKDELLNGVSIHTQLTGEPSGLSGLSSSHEFQRVFFLLLLATGLWLSELLLQQHFSAGLILLTSLLATCLLLGPDAGLLRLVTTLIILVVGQGLVVAMLQRKRMATTTA